MRRSSGMPAVHTQRPPRRPSSDFMAMLAQVSRNQMILMLVAPGYLRMVCGTLAGCEVYCSVQLALPGHHQQTRSGVRSRNFGCRSAGYLPPPALPDAYRWQDQDAAATAQFQQQQSGGLQAAQMHAAGGQPGSYLNNLAAY